MIHLPSSAQIQLGMCEPKAVTTSTENMQREQPLSSALSISMVEMRQELINANAKIRDLQGLVDEVEDGERNAQKDLRKTKDDWNAFYQKTLQELERTKELLNQTLRDKKQCEMRAKQSERELDACQNALFSLRSPDRKTDSQICDDWKELCVRIHNWIDSDSGDKQGPVLPRKRLKDDENWSMMSLEHYWGPDRQRMVDRHPGILEHLVRHEIHKLLYEEVFKDDVHLIGLRSEEANFIKSVEHGLKNLHPQRGKVC